MEITFKFQKTPLGWIIESPIKHGACKPSSRTKARNKEAYLIAPLLHSKDSFEVTYHIP